MPKDDDRGALNGTFRELFSLLDDAAPATHGFSIPNVSCDSGADEKTSALISFLNAVADSSVPTGDGSDEEISAFFSSLYAGGYRHEYSAICSSLYGYLASESDENRLDDGVPAQVNSIADGLRHIAETIGGDEATMAGILKLQDHIELERVRMEYMTRQNRALHEQEALLAVRMREYDAAIEEEKDKLEHIRDQIGAMTNDIEEGARRSARDHVTILGIFAAIVFSIVGAFSFSSSVLQSMGSVSIYRLLLTVLILAVFIFDLVASLYHFICKVVGYREEADPSRLVLWFNLFAAFLLVLTCVAYSQDWLHAIS